MRFQATGKYEQGVSDVDPVTNPDTILSEHLFTLPDRPDDPTALYLALEGTSTETVTLTLYFLLDKTPIEGTNAKYINAANRWFQFASGIVVTNGTIQKVTADLPGGGVVYARRTADTITASQIRPLHLCWRY